MIQKKLIYLLIGLSIILVFSNIIVEVLTTPEPIEIKTEDYISEIDSMFFSGIDRFGLSPDWITLTTLKNKNFDSLEYVYNLKIPADLPIAIIIKELNYIFENSNSVFYSDELKNHKRSVVKIESANQLKLQAYFELSDKLERYMPHLDFIVNHSKDLSVTGLNLLSEMLLPMTIALTPSNKSNLLIDTAEKLNFKYAIYVSDLIEDDKYKLQGVIEKNKIKKIIENYKNSFKTARYFIIDVNCSIYNSSVYPFIASQFQNQNISLIKETKFLQLEMKDVNEATSMYRYYTSERDTIIEKQLFISPNNMLNLKHEIYNQKKLGAKFF